jgi:hypothetical protein
MILRAFCLLTQRVVHVPHFEIRMVMARDMRRDRKNEQKEKRGGYEFTWN